MVGVVLGATRLAELLVVVSDVVVVVCAFAAVSVAEALVFAVAADALAAAVFAAALELVVRVRDPEVIAFSAALPEPVSLAPVGVCAALVCDEAEAWPSKLLAAITAKTPDSPAAPAAIARVMAEIRRRPASRARIARRVAGWGPFRGCSRRGLNRAARRSRWDVARRRSSPPDCARRVRTAD